MFWHFRAFVPPLLTDILFIYIIPDRKSTVMYEALSLICESGLIFSIEIPGFAIFFPNRSSLCTLRDVERKLDLKIRF